jgi:hypothetical protein
MPTMRTFTVDDTKFYNTTKPYTELGYLLGSKAEQTISFSHTEYPDPTLILFSVPADQCAGKVPEPEYQS